MKQRRLILDLLATLTAFAMLAGCGASPPADPASPATSSDPASPAASSEQAPASAEPKTDGEHDYVILSSTKGMDNEYYVELERGGRETAAQLNCQYITLSSEDSEQKQVADLESGLVTYQPDFVIIMPTSPSIMPSLCDLAENAGIPFVTLWDYPEGFDFTTYEYHLAHLLTDTFEEGKVQAQYLFDAMGGKGNIIAIDGPLGNTTATNRHNGLLSAMEEYPDIKLLESQPGDFNRFVAAPAFEDMYIKYGDDINGVWCANDDMAMGVLSILEENGKLGEIQVSGLDCLSDFLEHMKKGNTCVSLSGDAPGLQSLGVCIGYDFVSGGIRHETREDKFIIYSPPIVTPKNVEEWYEKWYGLEAANRDWTEPSLVKHPQ